MNEDFEPIAAEAIDYAKLAVSIVSAYVSNNHVQSSEVGSLIASTYAALSGLGDTSELGSSSPLKPTSDQIRKSITHDGLMSFEDGKLYKTLRRHLTIRGLTAEGYRQKWGLPRDYPMTAVSYSEQRSALARNLGLGQQRKKAILEPVEMAKTISEKPKHAGRRRKAKDAAEA